MASSVSAQRVLSSAGCGISKGYNRLQPDIVEALQFFKCKNRPELLFPDEVSTEREMEELEGTQGVAEVGLGRSIENLSGDEGLENQDEDGVFVQRLS